MNTRKSATILVKSICVKGAPDSEKKIILVIYKKKSLSKILTIFSENKNGQ